MGLGSVVEPGSGMGLRWECQLWGRKVGPNMEGCGVVSVVWCEVVSVLFQSVYGYIQVVCMGQWGGGLRGVVDKGCKPGSQPSPDLPQMPLLQSQGKTNHRACGLAFTRSLIL